MKKSLFFLTCFIVTWIHGVNADVTLPVPYLKYSCDDITNTNEVAPSIGSVTATITDGNATASDDASIVSDPERGSVLFLPNFLNASDKGDSNPEIRSLRISSTDALVGDGNYTISFWALTKAPTSSAGLNGFPPLLLFDGMTSGSFVMRINAFWSANADKTSIRFNGGSGGDKDLNTWYTSASKLDQWLEYVIVKKGTVIKLFINNELIAMNTAYNIANSQLKNLRFNGTAHGGGMLLDDIQIFHEALSEEQVALLYGQTGITMPDPFLKYSCDAIDNSNQMEPVIGNITGVITDGNFTTKNDASIVSDDERGSVLYLPNILNGTTNKGDAAPEIRGFRMMNEPSSLVGNGNFTISFWTKIKTQPQGANPFPAVLDFDNMSSGRKFSMRFDAWWAGNKPSLQFNAGSDQNLNSTLTPSSYIYNWAHYTIVKAGNTLHLYINNVLQASNGVYTLANSELKNLRLNGASHGGGSLFDDIQIFHEALNETQIAKLYADSKVKVELSRYPAAGGNISGGGIVSIGENLSAKATAAENYEFAYWSENGIPVSTDEEYEFEVSGARKLIAYFKPVIPEITPEIITIGENYTISELVAGNKVFLNRETTDEIDKMPLGNIPSDFAGWKFTSINAKSSYKPGPLPVISIKPSETGYVYVLVANVEQADVCAAWATDNGWELVPVYDLTYRANDVNAHFGFYKKLFTKDVVAPIVQPNVFSGAMVIAPNIKRNNFTIEATEIKTLEEYYEGDYGDIIFKSTESSTGQLSGITEEGLTVKGVVKYEKEFTPKQWYPIGFPFDIVSIYCADFEGTVDGAILDIYDGDGSAGSASTGDFWLKSYNGVSNTFAYSTSFGPGKGYAIQFPNDFEGKKVTFISTANPILKNTTNPVTELNSGYTLVANPSVANVTSITGAGNYYLYNYSTNGKFNDKHIGTVLSNSKSLKPFEAKIAVKDIDAGELRAIGVEEQETTLETNTTNDQVIKIHYFNLQGIEIPKPANEGIYLVTKIYESKKVEIEKIFFNRK